MNIPDNQPQREKIAMVIFAIGALAILGVFFATTIPNIRNISVPVDDVLRDVESPVNFQSQIQDIPEQFDQEIQEAERQEQLEGTFNGLEQRSSSPNSIDNSQVQTIE